MRTRSIAAGLVAVTALLASAAFAADLRSVEAPLPPQLPWDGASRKLVAKADDPWITPAEKSGFRTTPSYDETIAWLRRLTAASPDLRLTSIGKSPAGRDIWMVIASREHVFTPESMHRIGKPTLLAQAGIHSGEIDGKDAGMMLLRDIAFGRQRELLQSANLLFIPILNVDGHERASHFGRINQRGPDVMGWRTNARNLNLNRDYTKLDTEEMRALVMAIDHWRPDLYLDLHVTDGADYQYDVTYGWNENGYSPSLTRWLAQMFAPPVNAALRKMGHIPGPLVFPVGWTDVSNGLLFGNAQPRFSNGYGDARHLATVLVENHSLKPYEQRVLGMRVLLESTLQLLGQNSNTLRTARAEDESRRPDTVPLDWRIPQNRQPETMQFLGVASKTTLSPVSGTLRTEWLGQPVTMDVPVIRQNEVASSVRRAKAYWIPAEWGDIAGKLLMHGITVEHLPDARDVEVEMYRLQEPKLAPEQFEGHVRVEAKTTVEKKRQHFGAGSWRVTTDQPLGELVTILLEPASADSFLQWGFFLPILERTEYSESYMLEPLAEQMMAADPKLADEFRRKLATDAAFRGSAEQRLNFFYERSGYWDQQWLLYPVARER